MNYIFNLYFKIELISLSVSILDYTFLYGAYLNQRGNEVRGPEIKCTYAGNNHYY